MKKFVAVQTHSLLTTWVCGAAFRKESKCCACPLTDLRTSLSWNRHSWPRKNTSFHIAILTHWHGGLGTDVCTNPALCWVMAGFMRYHSNVIYRTFSAFSWLRSS